MLQVLCYRSYATGPMLQVLCYSSYATAPMLEVQNYKSYRSSLQVFCYRYFSTGLILQVIKSLSLKVFFFVLTLMFIQGPTILHTPLREKQTR